MVLSSVEEDRLRFWPEAWCMEGAIVHCAPHLIRAGFTGERTQHFVVEEIGFLRIIAHAPKIQ
jgi:hypothetical protein